MPEPSPRSRLTRASVRLYRLALLRYPASLRDRYGTEMADAFAELMDEAAPRGVHAMARVWLRVGRDLARPLPGPVGASPARRRTSIPLSGAFPAAVRSLRRYPGFSTLVIGVLGIGVALNVTVLSVVDAYLVRPLPYPQPERLVEVRPAVDAVATTNSADVFERAASWDLLGFTLVGDGHSEVVLGARVSPDFFDVFGAYPAVGRAFRTDDVGGQSVAVISHGLWVRRFGADPGILGRNIRAVSGENGGAEASFTVVGVLPAGFWHLNGYTDVLVPLDRGGPVYVGRLRSDVPLDRAERVLTARAMEADPGRPEDFRIRLQPVSEAYAVQVRPKLVALQGAALLVLLVGCANAGLLLLIRAAGRAREMGVRAALGAGTARLAAHVVWEGLILAMLAGLLGTGLGAMALSTLGEVIQLRLGRGVPGGVGGGLYLDWTVLLMTIAACVGIGLAFGSVSLWSAIRGDLAQVVRSGGRSGSEGSGARRARRLLVSAEVALSLTLLTGAGLLVRSALALEGTPLGFEATGLTAFNVGFTSAGADRADERLAFFEAFERDVAALPGTQGAGLVRGAPFEGFLTAREVERETGNGLPSPTEAVPQIATPGYFDVLGLQLLEGRGIRTRDGPGSERVAVVSASLAQQLWRGESALERRFRFSAWTMPEMDDEQGPWLTVVGVAADVADGLGGSRPTVYVPFAQSASPWMTLVVRTRQGATDVPGAVRAVLASLDPRTPVYMETDIDGAVARARAPSRFFATLLGAFSAFSLILAVLGLYGAAAYTARQRRRDIAVRMALGADAWWVEWSALKEGALTVGLGLAVGFLGGRLLASGLRDQLYGVEPGDPATALGVAGLLGLSAMVALWIPARSATRIDPRELLRDD